VNAQNQISAAITAHNRWKENLQRAIETGASQYQPSVVKQDNQCDFGKWLYEGISPDLRDSARFHAICQQHAKFHQEAAAVLALALQGRKEDAVKASAPGSQFQEISSALRLDLISWTSEVRNMTGSADQAVSQEKLQKILNERAQALSQVTETQTGENMPLVVFSLANEQYGIPTEFVREIQLLRDLTPVPCTPEFVVGVINIRGAIYSVIDIRVFFGVQKQPITDTTKVLLINAAGLELGIIADDVKGATGVAVSEIKPAPMAQGVAKEEYIQGVTKDMLIILNLEALLRDERVIVTEEVG
jgi:purine-binding chemotaxis protein CheW